MATLRYYTSTTAYEDITLYSSVDKAAIESGADIKRFLAVYDGSVWLYAPLHTNSNYGSMSKMKIHTGAEELSVLKSCAVTVGITLSSVAVSGITSRHTVSKSWGGLNAAGLAYKSAIVVQIVGQKKTKGALYKGNDTVTVKASGSIYHHYGSSSTTNCGSNGGSDAANWQITSDGSNTKTMTIYVSPSLSKNPYWYGAGASQQCLSQSVAITATTATGKSTVSVNATVANVVNAE